MILEGDIAVFEVLEVVIVHKGPPRIIHVLVFCIVISKSPNPNKTDNKSVNEFK